MKEESQNGRNVKQRFTWYKPDKKTGMIRTHYLVFDKSINYSMFTRSDDYIWVCRNLGRIGKKNEDTYKYMWARIPKGPEDTGDAFYNKRTDWNVLEYYPCADKEQQYALEPDELPFREEKTNELSYQLSFEDIHP